MPEEFVPTRKASASRQMDVTMYLGPSTERRRPAQRASKPTGSDVARTCRTNPSTSAAWPGMIWYSSR